MNTLRRRSFHKLIGSAAGGFAGRAVGRPFAALPAFAGGGSGGRFAGYGPLVEDRGARPVIDLPAGFQYRVLIERGDMLSNGDPRPTTADGMAAFAMQGGRTLLVMNHENQYRNTAAQLPVEAPDPYDSAASGGTSALIVTSDLRVERAFATSSGTVRNCSGGKTAWGTWITCEETDQIPGQANVPATQRHGYAFEVQPIGPNGAPRQVRLPGFGRYSHEAVAIDPATGIAYLTEDHAEGLLYRFVPAGRPSGFGDYAQAGRLEALRLEGVAQTESGVPVQAPFRASWVRIDDPDAGETPTRVQGARAGATSFSRGEGIAYSRGAVYFTATSGGAGEFGQIWRHTPGPNTADLFYEATDRNEMEMPDNITAHPTSGDFYVAEDGPGTDYLRIVTPEGRVYPFARQALTPNDPRQAGMSGMTDTAGDVNGSPRDGRIAGELAGPCFSPDGRVLFLDIQAPSMTLAIWGPFRQF